MRRRQNGDIQPALLCEEKAYEQPQGLSACAPIRRSFKAGCWAALSVLGWTWLSVVATRVRDLRRSMARLRARFSSQAITLYPSGCRG
jgi:hypothetical protein